MATQPEFNNTREPFRKGILQVDPSLLRGFSGNDTESFKNDFQKFLGKAGLHFECQAKLAERSTCKSGDEAGITLGEALPYTVEVIYVNDMASQKYKWHILFKGERDTQTYHNRLQDALDGKTFAPFEEIPTQLEGEQVQSSESEADAVFEDPIVASQILLHLWVLTDERQEDFVPLPIAKLRAIFRYAHYVASRNKMPPLYSAMVNTGYIKADGNENYRITAEGIQYIQQHFVDLSRSGKIEEIEKYMVEEYASSPDVRAELQGVKSELEKLGVGDKTAWSLTNRKNALMKRLDYLKQVDRGLSRLRTSFMNS
jgi:hypothetical protein